MNEMRISDSKIVSGRSTLVRSKVGHAYSLLLDPIKANSQSLYSFTLKHQIGWQ